MRILLIEPQKTPRPSTTPDTLESLQRLVGGPIQAI